MSEENLDLENRRLKRDNTLYRNSLKLSLIVAIGLLGLNFYTISQQKVILVPQGVDLTKKATVSNKEADEAYLQPIVDSILKRSMNQTPETVAKNLESILFMVSPEFYADFKADLTKQAKYFKSNNLTQSFFETRREYQPNQIIVFGFAKKSIGQNNAPDEETVVEISYLINGGRFELTGLKASLKKDYQQEQNARKLKK